MAITADSSTVRSGSTKFTADSGAGWGGASPLSGSPVARIGDPISHGGTIIEGSPNTFANGIKVARKGDKVSCNIHGVQTIVDGNEDWPVNGKAIARVGSTCTCGATITAGSPNINSGK